jgi:hypothetical protein
MSYLEQLGYKVIEIPEGEGRSADLWASTESDQLIIEVKSRVDDEEVASILRDFPSGKSHVEIGSIARAKAIGRLVEDAVEQLRNSSKTYSGFWIIWLRSSPLLGVTHSPEQLEAALLGIRWSCVHKKDDFWFAPCYFADRTDFHKFPCIAGAVIDYGDRGKLLLNPYSPKLDEFRKTKLFKTFLSGDAVFDARDIDDPRQALVLLIDFDRSDEAQVLKVLEERYPGCSISFVEMHSLRGYMKLSE